MSPDNNPGTFLNVKRREVDPVRMHTSSGWTGIAPSPHDCLPMDISPPDDPSPPFDISSFVPRQFPPPALADIPVEYIVAQLHRLARNFWNRPETADCTIIVPIPNSLNEAPNVLDESPECEPDELPNGTHGPGLARRATESNLESAPQLTFKLHTEYLSAKSILLRAILSGASPLDLANSVGPSPLARSSPSSRRHSAPFHVPDDRRPRFLSLTPTNLTIFLPVPDPGSIHLLFHWMYFGRTHGMATSLAQGMVHWEGLARNAEYLGLHEDIKIFLGRWYIRWLSPRHHDGAESRPDDCMQDSDEDDSYTYNSDDEGDDGGYSTSASPIEDEKEEVAHCERGRARTVRCMLGISC